ncbi:hypothetical protein WJX84_008379 [Apatococcus fuscideae]|uniref:Exostosin GT47 domain-containing protein n=1 Tax=Apatococcus fuscideae TaxID=2026836 RepID=A0AAW1STB8_9CHLO
MPEDTQNPPTSAQTLTPLIDLMVDLSAQDRNSIVGLLSQSYCLATVAGVRPSALLTSVPVRWMVWLGIHVRNVLSRRALHNAKGMGSAGVASANAILAIGATTAPTCSLIIHSFPATSQHTPLRPRVYVYDLPPIYNSRMLEYRSSKGVCTYRNFEQDNSTSWPTWQYRAEPLLHEMLLQSQHRTLDPDEADFFYVPVYTSCFMWPIYGWADAPWFGPSGHTDDVGPGACLTIGIEYQVKNTSSGDLTYQIVHKPMHHVAREERWLSTRCENRVGVQGQG